MMMRRRRRSDCHSFFAPKEQYRQRQRQYINLMVSLKRMRAWEGDVFRHKKKICTMDHDPLPLWNCSNHGPNFMVFLIKFTPGSCSGFRPICPGMMAQSLLVPKSRKRALEKASVEEPGWKKLMVPLGAKCGEVWKNALCTCRMTKFTTCPNALFFSLMILSYFVISVHPMPPFF